MEGSVDFTGALFCTLVFLARHQRLRSVALAQSKAGLALVRMELAVVFAYLHAPLKSEGSYMALTETFKERHASLDFTNPHSGRRFTRTTSLAHMVRRRRQASVANGTSKTRGTSC